MTRIVWLTVAVAMVVAAGALGASAVLRHGGDANLVHACVRQHDGAVRIVSPTHGNCHFHPGPGWVNRDWSIVGPSGPSGPSGAKGATGATGPSDAFFDNQTAFLSIVIPTTFVTVVSLASVPAGKYVLNASLFFSTNAGPTSVQCVLTLNGVISGLGGQVTLAAGPSEFATMPLTAGLDLAVPTTVDAQCQSGLALGVTSAPSRMTMIRVGSLAPA